jgi:lysophospholipid acyltransferase (LPLAT)-like uncharacterized protein
MREAAKSNERPDMQRPSTHFDTTLPEYGFWRRMQIPVIAWAVYWVIRGIGTTLRIERIGLPKLGRIQALGKPLIWVFWHNTSMAMAWVARNRGIVVMNSTNFDGQWTRRVVERLGFGTAQGSSTRGGLSGLTALARCLEEGHDVAFTIDGPRGPRYFAKAGPVMLARQTGCPILVVHVGVQEKRVLERTWDLFQIPRPFTKAVVLGSGPIFVPSGADRETIDRTRDEMQKALEAARDATEGWWELSPEERERQRGFWSA